jgi:GNAT superfamily N-acetyltransferase
MFGSYRRGAVKEMVVESEFPVTLCDGSAVCIRPLREADRPMVMSFLQGLSNESRFLRFFSPCVDLEKEADTLAAVEEPDRFGLVATAGPEGPIIGHACCALVGPARAESAVVVADEVQGRGLGGLLLTRLARAAFARGITVFEGEVLPENHRLLACVRKAFPVTIRSGPGWMHIEFPTGPGQEAVQRGPEKEEPPPELRVELPAAA